MKKTKKKFLSVLSAGLVAVQAVAPMLGTGVGAVSEENLVRKATPVLDGVLDEAYATSYSFKLSDWMKAENAKMSAFLLQTRAFNTIYFDEDGNSTGYIKIYAEDGSEITDEMFADLYDSDYDSLPKDDKGSITCKFEWTDAGYASEYFTDATYSLLWDDEAVYVHVSVTDKTPLGLTQDQYNDAFSGGWAAEPWIVDCVYATLRIDNAPHTQYAVSDGDPEKNGDHPKGEIYIDEKKSTSYTDVTVIASGTGSGPVRNDKGEITGTVDYDGIFYYANREDCYFDKDTLEVVSGTKLTTLNPFSLNWWKYAFYQDDYPGGAERRARVCDGTDTEEGEETCVSSPTKFITTHIMTPEALKERDDGRAENLENVFIEATDNGYVVEMKIPLTEEAFSAIEKSGNVIGLAPQIVNALPSTYGANITGGSAQKFIINSVSEYINGDSENSRLKAISLKLTDEEYVYVPGDVNADGAVNAKDIVRLMQYIANEGNGVTVTKTDLNNDGVTNTKDLVRLMKYIAAEGEGVEIF